MVPEGSEHHFNCLLFCASNTCLTSLNLCMIKEFYWLQKNSSSEGVVSPLELLLLRLISPYFREILEHLVPGLLTADVRLHQRAVLVDRAIRILKPVP